MRDAREGEMITVLVGPTHDEQPMDVTVLSKCGETLGHWYCVTHNEGFANNLSMDGHTGDNRAHLMAWACHAHGFEMP